MKVIIIIHFIILSPKGFSSNKEDHLNKYIINSLISAAIIVMINYSWFAPYRSEAIWALLISARII